MDHSSEADMKSNLLKGTMDSGQGSTSTEYEIHLVERMLEREKTHAQWDKHLLCLIVLVSQCLINLFRGSKANPSIVGIEHCGPVDWVLFALYLAICCVMSVVSIKRVMAE